MAVITCNLNPWGLAMRTSFSLILPEQINTGDAPANYKDRLAGTRKFPVLWLLHGAGGNHSDWLNGTDILELSRRFGVAVVMPDAQKSSYVDMAFGPKWFTYLTQSLPQFVYTHFPISDKREDNFVAGASMGGYGAFKFALSCPAQYAAAAAMGSGVRLPQKYAGRELDGPVDSILTAAFGDDRSKVLGGPNDCYALAKQAVANGIELPKLLSCCGKKDFSYTENTDFRDYMYSLGLQIDWVESDEGHTLQAWKEFLPIVMEWLPLPRKDM